MASPGFLECVWGILKFTLHDFGAYANIALCKRVSYLPQAQNKGSSATGKGGCPQPAPHPPACFCCFPFSLGICQKCEKPLLKIQQMF